MVINRRLVCMFEEGGKKGVSVLPLAKLLVHEKVHLGERCTRASAMEYTIGMILIVYV